MWAKYKFYLIGLIVLAIGAGAYYYYHKKKEASAVSEITSDNVATPNTAEKFAIEKSKAYAYN